MSILYFDEISDIFSIKPRALSEKKTTASFQNPRKRI